jgi:HKD family nuclease
MLPQVEQQTADRGQHPLHNGCFVWCDATIFTMATKSASIAARTILIPVSSSESET